ncbi:MAG: hypothetical protein O2954_18940 [bacterium]|nr:hypothetical protein [bacterium]
MAWIYQRGKKWWIGYYDDQGKRVRKSVSGSKEVAELALKRVEAELARKNPGSLTVPEAALEVIGRHLGQEAHMERLATYPGIRNATNVRELFIRIYDRLDFEVLKSQEEFPHYVLSARDKPVRAHAVVRSSDFREQGLDYLSCDSIVCWIHDWEDAPITVLELSRHYDFFG